MKKTKIALHLWTAKVYFTYLSMVFSLAFTNPEFSFLTRIFTLNTLSGIGRIVIGKLVEDKTPSNELSIEKEWDGC